MYAFSLEKKLMDIPLYKRIIFKIKIFVNRVDYYFLIKIQIYLKF